MTLKDFFLKLGYNISPFLSNESNIGIYEQWYSGFCGEFHRYYVYNGNKKIYRNRYSLRFPKKICETFADLICNERVKIHLSDESASQKLEEILSENNFRLKLNQSIEKAFAFGYGAFVLCIEDNRIKIQFVECKNIIPLKYDNNNVYEVAFVSDSYEDGVAIRNIQVHHLNDQKQYVIDNFKMEVSSGGELKHHDFEDIPKTIETKSELPWFAIIKPNIANNVLLDSPFGIPIYYNSLDSIKALDIIYDSFVNEIQNGRKRLFVTADALKVNSSGQLSNAFDPNDVLFYLLEGEEEQSKTYVQEINGELRIEELKLALQTNLDILSSKLGLGDSYFKVSDFNNHSTTKTATEVISSNSDLYRTISKHCILIGCSVKSLIKSIQFISKEIFGVNIDGDIFIDFDDSIIESDAEKREQDRKDVELGAMSLAEYRSKWYDEPLDVAESKISSIKYAKETPITS